MGRNAWRLPCLVSAGGPLNRIAAAEVDRGALAKDLQQGPCDLVGGSHCGSMEIDREQRNAILNAELFIPSRIEPLSGDDYPIEYHEDGFPKLPACLNRKAKRLLIEQAVA